VRENGNDISRRIGLARTLSKLGYCSRSRATELIRSGRVSLNGSICRDPETPVSGKTSQLAVDGETIQPEKKIYWMLNKPRGVVTTASDEKGRQTVYSIMNRGSENGTGSSQASQPWVAPVGRLDKASEGLLLLTNDSEWGSRIAAPESHLDKTYHVQIASIADEDLLQKLVRGVKVKAKAKDGEVLRARWATRLRAGKKNCWLEIVLDEGKNRQIRRMMEAIGVDVLRLIRIAIGPLQLGDLAKGEHRALTTHEKQLLDRALQAKTKIS
jgi:23S rRNA pseudouridine2605 synthase